MSVLHRFLENCHWPHLILRHTRLLSLILRRMRRAHTNIPGFSMGDLSGEAEEEEEVSVMKEGIVTRKEIGRAHV